MPAPFPIWGRAHQPIRSLEEWLRHAPPAGRERQWREGRSALELARHWLPGRLPDEVKRVLATSGAFRDFAPVEAFAEYRTRLDHFAGGTRTHDLLVTGSVNATDNGTALLDVEGKADESFGPTIGERLAAARVSRGRNPRSRATERVEWLCQSVLDARPEDVEPLRYQLLHATAAAIIAAEARGARQVAWIVHEIRSPGLRTARQQANAHDLAAFVERLGAASFHLDHGTLTGPIQVHRASNLPREVTLWIGKSHAVLPGR
jgi:hypothetical protein